MINDLVLRWEKNKHLIKEEFQKKHPDDYKEVVLNVIKHITSEDEYGDYNLDPERIHEIDDGDYQGTLIYVIGAKGYQPSDYWAVSVNYGSCSGCDTLQRIQDYSNDAPDEDQVKDYMTLALHIVQGIKEI